MSIPVPLRGDVDPPELRRMTRSSKGANRVRRFLAHHVHRIALLGPRVPIGDVSVKGRNPKNSVRKTSHRNRPAGLAIGLHLTYV